MIIEAILDLKKRLEALQYLLEETKKPENKVAVEIYDDLLELIYLLLWDNLVIRVSWLYDERGERSLFWYLKEKKKSPKANLSAIDKQLKRIKDLKTTAKKVRTIRNKWVAHRDKETDNLKEFFAKNPLNIKDIEELVNTAAEIADYHFPVTDLTRHGLHMLFWIIESNPEIEQHLRSYGVFKN